MNFRTTNCQSSADRGSATRSTRHWSLVIGHWSLLCSLCVLLFTLLAAGRASAFSLLGPIDAYANLPGGSANWPIPRIGYNVFNTDIGVPVNLGEEYRWHKPIVTYAFDESFLNYFGQQGVEAIESAIQVLRDLPPASEINVDDFPLENKRINGTAQQLGILDLKSTALSTLLEIFGLAAPERFVYTLRDRAQVTIGGVTFTNYIIINRNFDPVTLQPTNRVNGASYTYIVQEFPRPQDWADASEKQIDVLEFGYSSVAGALSSPIYNADIFISTNALGFNAGVGGFGPGEIFPGLTRDDAGGWRYLLRRNNWNVENLATNTFLDTNALAAASQTNGIAPWTPVFVTTNNLVVSNTFGGNSPWTPFVPITNVFTNAFGTNITNVLVVTALRSGVEKIRFKRINFDSLLGQTFGPVTNRFNDLIISNFTKVTQKVMEVRTLPDLIFAAADLGTTANAESPVVLGRGVNRINNDAINGITALGGPGVLEGPMTITFSSILPAILEEHDPFGVFSFPTIVWGSFDDSSEDIIVFPNSLSLQELEELINQRLRP